jgi:glyoxylate/hydroxypyruvate reductase A
MNNNISICLSNISPKPWVESLKKEFPDATVSVWKPGNSLADYAIVWDPPQQFIDEQSGVKALFNIGAGVDNLLQLSLPASLKIVRLEDAGMSLEMSEYVCHAVIRYFREFKQHETNKQLSKWSYRKTKTRNDFTIGVMGLGTLGMQVVKTLQMFQYPINGYSRDLKEIEGVNCFSGEHGLTEFLNNTRVLVNLLPLTAETENIMNYDTLSKLQEGGYVINVARGKHLVDDDLLKLIDIGHLSGATLDVFRTEPLAADHPFWKHPKITITPHTAARTQREESITQIARKIQSLQHGTSITGLVDLLKGY